MKTGSLKILLWLLLFLEIVLIPSPWNKFRPTRRHAVKALVEWQKNPTPQTEAAWLSEKRKLDQDDLIQRVVSIALLVGNTTLMILIWRHLKRQRTIVPQDRSLNP